MSRARPRSQDHAWPSDGWPASHLPVPPVAWYSRPSALCGSSSHQRPRVLLTDLQMLDLAVLGPWEGRHSGDLEGTQCLLHSLRPMKKLLLGSLSQ